MSSKRKTIKSESSKSMKTASKRKIPSTSDGRRKKRKFDVNLNDCPPVEESISRWTDEEFVAEIEGVDVSTVKNIIKLFNEENTIPFMARYRSHLTGGLRPDKIRKIKDTYDYGKRVRYKAEQLVAKISATNQIPASLLQYIYRARSLEELDFLSAPYRNESKGVLPTLAERAKRLGLEGPAEKLLNGTGRVSLESLVNPKVEGLNEVRKVKLGIKHIIADVLHNDAEVHVLLRDLINSGQLILQSKMKQTKIENKRESSKYDLYANFSQKVGAIKHYQVLAINRGESEDILTVRLVIPDELWTPIKKHCWKKWMSTGDKYKARTELFESSLNDAIKRLLAPFVTRRIRTVLKEEAENEAVNVFANNLRQLLMTPPHRGKVVMGIDPGFHHGCKVAVVSQTGNLLAYDKFFLSQNNKKFDSSHEKIVKLALKFRCETFVLGNGVGCREAETLLNDLIEKGSFKPLNVSYTIISEQGVSFYSCSSAALEEFPDLDPTFISAVSLARRLQDPLSELVKVEPKHLGVGMYQHDVKEKKMVAMLEEIVCECVSFVGVDINSASYYLLKRVAGLRSNKAREIVKFRTMNCPFKTREDLKRVRGISVKTFQQCAGFIRVIPCTAQCKQPSCCKAKLNPLDQTSIHPESYDVTSSILRRFGLNLSDLGSKKFIEEINRQRNKTCIDTLAKDVDSSTQSVLFILESLSKPINFDERCLSEGPIFQFQKIKVEQLVPGDNVTGVVRNIVPFGAFVDVGVGLDGLIHCSQMENKTLRINSRVRVEVKSINYDQKRMRLKLLNVIETG